MTLDPLSPSGVSSPSPARLDRQLAFLAAADALKAVARHNHLLDGSRRENAAEHSWHLTLMAFTLAEHAPAGTDLLHVVELLAMHDLVEVHAGDHWVVDANAAEVAQKEGAAAERLFALLPDDQRDRLAALWTEYEARATPEARFARALDALHPMVMVWGPGASDLVHAPLTASEMRDRKRPALEAYPGLWTLAQRLLADATERGVLPP